MNGRGLWLCLAVASVAAGGDAWAQRAGTATGALDIGQLRRAGALDLKQLEALVQEMEAIEERQPLPIGGETPLTFGHLRESVALHHPMLVAATERLRRARGAEQEARGAFDLTLNVRGTAIPRGFYDYGYVDATVEQPTPLWGTELFAGWRLGRGNVPPYYGELRTLGGGELRAGVRVPVWRGGPIDPRRAGIGRAERTTDAAEAEVTQERLALEIAAAETYWRWVAAGQAYQVGRELVELAEVRDAQLAAMVERGAIAPIERAENLRALLGRLEELVADRRGLEQAAIQVSLYLRDEAGQRQLPASVHLPRNMPPPPPGPIESLQEGVERALAFRPEMRRFEALVEAAEVDVALARNNVAPRFDLEIAAAKDVGNGTDPALARTLEPAELRGGLMFSLPVQLRVERGQRTQAEARLAEARAQALWQRDRVVTQVEDLWSALETARERADLALRAARVAAAVAAGERDRFEAGATSLFIVNLREQAAGEAERRAIRTLAELQVALTAWNLATSTEQPEAR